MTRPAKPKGRRGRSPSSRRTGRPAPAFGVLPPPGGETDGQPRVTLPHACRSDGTIIRPTLNGVYGCTMGSVSRYPAASRSVCASSATPTTARSKEGLVSPLSAGGGALATGPSR